MYLSLTLRLSSDIKAPWNKNTAGYRDSRFSPMFETCLHVSQSLFRRERS